MWTTIFKALLTLLVLIPSTLLAHDARPLYLQINELDRGQGAVYRYTLKLQVPPSIKADNRPQLTFPVSCERERQGLIVQLNCRAPLVGQSLEINYPQYNPSITTLVRATFQSGVRYQQLLSPSENRWQVPMERNTSAIISEYSLLGIEHILIGWDHLLFLFCLLLIAGTLRRTLITVSGFTLAHSLTLVLTTLGIIRVPIAPVEALIAFSILCLAAEIIRNRQDTLAWRYPMAVSILFGLIHGFGFAAVLQDIGLPQNELGTALLFFNIGVEVGQVLFIGAVMGLFALLGRWPAFPLLRIQQAMIYTIGSLAAFWSLQRIAGF